jgi:hypothetical protein
MFTDKIELSDFEKMDQEYKELLGRVLTIQADCEIGGPHLYVHDILPSAPTKIDQLIVARTAAEEIDHFRKIAYLQKPKNRKILPSLNGPSKSVQVAANNSNLSSVTELICLEGRF